MGLIDGNLSPDQNLALGLLGMGLMRGDFAGGGGQALQYLAGADERKLKMGLLGAQLENYKSEVAQREVAMKKQQQLMDLAQRIIKGGGYEPAQQGQLGSGTFGIMPTAPGQADIPANRPSGFAGANFDDITALHALGGPDLTNAYKFTREGIKRDAGSTYEPLNGGPARYFPKIPENQGFDPATNRTFALPGALDTVTQMTLAQEAPKAVLNAAGNVNMRPNANGTQSPVPVINESPLLQGILSNLSGRGAPQQQPFAPAPPLAPRAASGNPPAGSGMVAPTTPTDRVATLQEALAQNQALLKRPDLNDADRARVTRDVQDIQGELTRTQSVGGVPQYGKTTEQQNKDAADKAYAEKVAGDVVEQRKAIMAAGTAAPTNIAKYQKLGQLLQGVDGGTLTPTGTHIASMMNSVGIKVDKNLPNKEAAAALGNEMALQLRNPAGGAGMPGALSDQDRVFLQSMTPNQAQSAQGRATIISARIALEQRSQQVAQFARNYEKKHQRLDNGFFDQLQQWSNANPLFGSK